MPYQNGRAGRLRHPRNFSWEEEKGGTTGVAFHALLASHVTRLASGRRKIGIVLSREEAIWRIIPLDAISTKSPGMTLSKQLVKRSIYLYVLPATNHLSVLAMSQES